MHWLQMMYAQYFMMMRRGCHGHHGHHHHHHHRPHPHRPPQENQPTIANGETAKVWGDPHFVGGDGGKYDVQGEQGKTYNLLTDSGLKFFGTFESWQGKNDLTVVGQSDIIIRGGGGRSHIHFDPKKDCATHNGREIRQGKRTVLADGGTVERKGADLIVRTAEGYEIVQHDRGGHIDAEINTGKRGVYNGKMPTGLMGCTFDGDNKARDGKKGHGAQGEGAIDGTGRDYEVKPWEMWR